MWALSRMSALVYRQVRLPSKLLATTLNRAGDVARILCVQLLVALEVSKLRGVCVWGRCGGC